LRVRLDRDHATVYASRQDREPCTGPSPGGLRCRGTRNGFCPPPTRDVQPGPRSGTGLPSLKRQQHHLQFSGAISGSGNGRGPAFVTGVKNPRSQIGHITRINATANLRQIGGARVEPKQAGHPDRRPFGRRGHGLAEIVLAGKGLLRPHKLPAESTRRTCVRVPRRRWRQRCGVLFQRAGFQHPDKTNGFDCPLGLRGQAKFFS